MDTSQCKQQIPLISTRLKANNLEYFVEKEGVLFLRKMRTRKLRVIFNVIPLNKEQPLTGEGLAFQFNQHLIGTKSQQAITQDNEGNFELQQKQGKTNEVQSLPRLTIHPSHKQISQNRQIIILNLYQPASQPPYILILGYLISSVIFYHNFTNEFSPTSPLTNMLCSFSQLLKKTNIDKLNEEIKFKTGYEKTPYLMCLLGMFSGDKDKTYYQSRMNDFYRFREDEQQSAVNYALQAIIDYFPERSSLGIEIDLQRGQLTPQGRTKTAELGHQFESTILGRQLFSFQFTSSTIESLSFELCAYFNELNELNLKQPSLHKPPQTLSLDLIQIYNNVIINKKSRLQLQYKQKYLQLIKQRIFLNNKIQIDDIELTQNQQLQLNNIGRLTMSELSLRKELASIRDWVNEQLAEEALNCMSLEQYLVCRNRVIQHIKCYEQKLLTLNEQAATRFIEQCYCVVEINEDDINFLDQPAQDGTNGYEQYSIMNTQHQQQQRNKPLELPSRQQISELFLHLTSRLSSFSHECIDMLTSQDQVSTKHTSSFMTLTQTYFKILSTKMSSLLQRASMQLRQYKLQNDTLKYQMNKLHKQNKRLQEQYQLQLMIQSELKHQIQQLSLAGQLSHHLYSVPYTSHFNSNKELVKVKKQLEAVQEQLGLKNNLIQDLNQILTKFQSTHKQLPDHKLPDLLTLSIKQLILQANDKINAFYSIIEEVKLVDKHYDEAKKILLKEKQAILNEKKHSLKEILNIKQQSEKLIQQNNKLQQILIDSKNSLNTFNQLKQTLKLNIADLESTNTELKCLLAEEQGDKQLYRKALSLVVEYATKGKSQNLLKFFKFLQHSDIKEMLKLLIKK